MGAKGTTCDHRARRAGGGILLLLVVVAVAIGSGCVGRGASIPQTDETPAEVVRRGFFEVSKAFWGVRSADSSPDTWPEMWCFRARWLSIWGREVSADVQSNSSSGAKRVGLAEGDSSLDCTRGAYTGIAGLNRWEPLVAYVAPAGAPHKAWVVPDATQSPLPSEETPLFGNSGIRDLARGGFGFSFRIDAYDPDTRTGRVSVQFVDVEDYFVRAYVPTTQVEFHVGEPVEFVPSADEPVRLAPAGAGADDEATR
jgi:hypothetical protein